MDWQRDLSSFLESEEGVDRYESLLRVDSLTQGLKRCSPHFSVELVYLGRSLPRWDEAEMLLSDDGALIAREVYLCLEGVRVIHARTVARLQSPQWRTFLDCGTASLGNRLFDHTLPLERTPFQYALLPLNWQGDEEGKAGQKQGQAVAIARRSLFHWKGDPLMIMEQYLPALEAFL